MSIADDAVARWEARNVHKLVAEEAQRNEDRRKSRMIAFTRVDLMRAVLSDLRAHELPLRLQEGVRRFVAATGPQVGRLFDVGEEQRDGALR